MFWGLQVMQCIFSGAITSLSPSSLAVRTLIPHVLRVLRAEESRAVCQRSSFWVPAFHLVFGSDCAADIFSKC